MDALGLENDKQKRALLLHSIGERVFDIFVTLSGTGENYQTATQKLDERFHPESNTEFDKWKFKQCVQQQGESVESFHTRLQQIAALCAFVDVTAEVKTQLIHGCTSAKLRRKGLTDGTMTLAKLLSEGRSMEIVEKQSKGIEQALKETSINKVTHQHFVKDSRRQRQETSTSGESKCLNCGGKYPHQGGMRRCPAQGVRCDACGRVGHFRKW